MSYFEKLHPWCLVRTLPNLQRITVARFRRRHDAEAHMKTVQRLIPSATYTVIFSLDTKPSKEAVTQEAQH